MDVSEYDCGIRQDEHKKLKLSDSYSIGADSGYDSIYNGCASVLMEKSFSRESFDIFSPNSSNRTPSKQSSTLKYHVSTPKSNATVKRHLYSTLKNSSISKRIRSQNDENNPKAILNNAHSHDLSFPLPPNKYEFSRQNYLLTPTKAQIQKDEVFNINHSIYMSYREEDPVLMPERPSKSNRFTTPTTVIHSKRKLDILPVKEKNLRTYCNGTKFLNIIARLEPFPLILDDIFKNLKNKDLLNMTHVSKNWSRIVKSNLKAHTRIRRYLSESHNVKENRRVLTKFHTSASVERCPFGKFNSIATPKINLSTSTSNSSFDANQSAVQQLCKNERLIKCPRCSKGGIVSDSAERLQLATATRVPAASSSDSLCATNLFHDSFESESIYSIAKEKIKSAEPKSVFFGVCTSLSCKFIFCPKCLCGYHPGEHCKISDPESPSKLLVCRKSSKHKSKSICKLSSKKQSLRRLCFS